jgi:hypothetical protein
MHFSIEEVGGLEDEPLGLIVVTIESLLCGLDKLDQHGIGNRRAVGLIDWLSVR